MVKRNRKYEAVIKDRVAHTALTISASKHCCPKEEVYKLWGDPLNAKDRNSIDYWKDLLPISRKIAKKSGDVVENVNAYLQQPRRTLAQLKTEDPVAYLCYVYKGQVEGSMSYAYDNWSDPGIYKHGWRHYRKEAIKALKTNGDIPTDEETRKLLLKSFRAQKRKR